MNEYGPIKIVDNNHQSSNLSETTRHLWSEPLTRPDGQELAIVIWGDGTAYVTVGGFGATYSRAEQVAAGNGDSDRGIARIGQAWYALDNVRDRCLMGEDKPFAQELSFQ